MYLIRIAIILFLIVFVQACRSKSSENRKDEEADPRLLIYRSSETRINDLVHTKLELHPDFKQREMRGMAVLTIEPHFYPVDSLILDAVYMRIEKVSILQSTPSGFLIRIAAGYSYDSLKLRIGLDKRYNKNESYSVEINYVAQPEKIPAKGSSAISSRKGLYFINHDGKDKSKPTQLWTQGETQAASCWFPTIDAPNQKSSMELSVEVPSKFKSLSNGLLLRSEKTSDSTRTDFWKQDKPHAPYLFALVVGDFAEVKDQWKNKEVNYFVEPAYAKYAKLIFGNTPEMIEFYSNILDYPYPWDKYHQVVVRDFVSGAMENTGAVVHYDKLQHDNREHLDETYEDIIAHELFHHWFGDLVTTESWSNLALNESFATYGEYLWNEYKYGRDEADYKLSDFHGSYLGESEYKTENLIRYNYIQQEDMFDAHSYQKGGSILHMLRKYAGDQAFFAALKLYLEKNAYQTVEASDLRKAFEDVTGEDLNWFFDQWFLDKGHPQLSVRHEYKPETGYQIVVIQKSKRFKLPVDIDVYSSGEKTRTRVIIDRDTQTIKIKSADNNSYVQFDSENQLLSDKNEIKTTGMWEKQLNTAVLAAHRADAFNHLIDLEKDETIRLRYCQTMLKDSFWYNRQLSLWHLNKWNFKIATLETLSTQVKEAVMNEKVAAVRTSYVSLLGTLKDETTLKSLLADSSYSVLRRTLAVLGNMNKEAAFSFVDGKRENTHRVMRGIIYNTIGRFSTRDETSYFLGLIENGEIEIVESAASSLGAFLLYNQPQNMDKALTALITMAGNKDQLQASKNAGKAMRNLYYYFYYQSYSLKRAIDLDKSYKSKFKPSIELCERAAKRLKKEMGQGEK